MPKKEKLTPPDLNQCQAEYGPGAFTMGGKIGKKRCPNRPVVLAQGPRPGDGKMSLCEPCKVFCEKVTPGVTFETLPDKRWAAATLTHGIGTPRPTRHLALLDAGFATPIRTRTKEGNLYYYCSEGGASTYVGRIADLLDASFTWHIENDEMAQWRVA